MEKISAVLVVRNEESVIEGCLKSLKGFADEIIVVDGYSTDKTRQICKRYGAKIFLQKPRGYCEPFREFGVKKAKNDWILNLDADERITPELKRELAEIMAENKFDAYFLPRKTFFFGHEIKIINPDYQLRFYKKGSI